MDYTEKVMWDMNNCDSTCEGLGMYDSMPAKGVTNKTDWLLEHIPGISYGLERTINYIFSNGLTTGDKASTQRLTTWLFEGKNALGATNYSVLQQAIKYAHVYGEWGLRWYEGNLYDYKQGHFGMLVSKENGIEQIHAYYIRKDGEKVTKDVKLEWTDWDVRFDDADMILLDPSEFCVIRNDPTKLHGTPILLSDKERVNLLLSTYQRLNYDIDYDGPGRLFFWEDSGYIKNENGVSTTTESLNNSPRVKEERTKRAREEVEALAKKIKTAGSDSIGVLSKALSKDVLKIPRVTKSTEFFGWIEGEGKIVAQLLGMSAVLLEVGDWSGNVSMGKIIDNAMLNTIIPMREKYAIQFSEFLASKLGVPKVYFDLYDMQQAKDVNEDREKVANTIFRLARANDSFENANVEKVIDELAEMLSASLYNDAGNLKELSVKRGERYVRSSRDSGEGGQGDSDR